MSQGKRSYEVGRLILYSFIDSRVGDHEPLGAQAPSAPPQVLADNLYRREHNDLG